MRLQRLFILLLITSCLFSIVSASDVLLKDGCYLRNIEIIDSSATRIKCRFQNRRILSFQRSNVQRIDNTVYDPLQKSRIENCPGKRALVRLLDSQPIVYGKTSNPAGSGEDLFPTFIDGNLGYVNSQGIRQNFPKISYDVETFRIRLSETETVEYPQAVTELRFHDSLAIFQKGSGFFSVSSRKSYQAIDANGEKLFDLKANWVGTFSEGLAQVAVPRRFLILTTGEKYGYIDTRGAYVIKPQFDFAGPFSEGKAHVRIKKSYGYINKTGRLLIPPRFQQAFAFSDGLAAVRFQGKCGYIDGSGNWVIEAVFDQAWPFSEGLARVFVDGGYFYINSSGKRLNETPFDFALDFQDGLACVRSGPAFTFLDTNMVAISPEAFERASYFGDGLAPVMKNGFWGYVAADGSMTIPFRYRYAYPFRNGTAIVWDDIGPGYITPSGKHLGYLLDND